MRLSYSKLNTYRQCPLRYRFTYLDRLPRRPRRTFRAATRLHRALMAWLAYARLMGQNRRLTDHPLNPKLFSAEMLARRPKT